MPAARAAAAFQCPAGALIRDSLSGIPDRKPARSGTRVFDKCASFCIWDPPDPGGDAAKL